MKDIDREVDRRAMEVCPWVLPNVGWTITAKQPQKNRLNHVFRFVPVSENVISDLVDE
jgi:hypothetical protein